MTDFKAGDVVAYDTLTRPNRHCREGTAILNDRGVLVDTFWGGALVNDAHVLTEEEAATARLLFNIGDYAELGRTQAHQFEQYAPADRQVLTSQHGLQRRLFVRIGAQVDHATIVDNARRKVDEAEARVRSAQLHLDWAREDLARLEGANA